MIIPRSNPIGDANDIREAINIFNNLGAASGGTFVRYQRRHQYSLSALSIRPAGP